MRKGRSFSNEREWPFFVRISAARPDSSKWSKRTAPAYLEENPHSFAIFLRLRRVESFIQSPQSLSLATKYLSP